MALLDAGGEAIARRRRSLHPYLCPLGFLFFLPVRFCSIVFSVASVLRRSHLRRRSNLISTLFGISAGQHSSSPTNSPRSHTSLSRSIMRLNEALSAAAAVGELPPDPPDPSDAMNYSSWVRPLHFRCVGEAIRTFLMFLGRTCNITVCGSSSVFRGRLCNLLHMVLLFNPPPSLLLQEPTTNLSSLFEMRNYLSLVNQSLQRNLRTVAQSTNCILPDLLVSSSLLVKTDSSLPCGERLTLMSRIYHDLIALVPSGWDLAICLSNASYVIKEPLPDKKRGEALLASLAKSHTEQRMDNNSGSWQSNGEFSPLFYSISHQPPTEDHLYRWNPVRLRSERHRGQRYDALLDFGASVSFAPLEPVYNTWIYWVLFPEDMVSVEEPRNYAPKELNYRAPRTLCGSPHEMGSSRFLWIVSVNPTSKSLMDNNVQVWEYPAVEHEELLHHLSFKTERVTLSSLFKRRDLQPSFGIGYPTSHVLMTKLTMLSVVSRGRRHLRFDSHQCQAIEPMEQTSGIFGISLDIEFLNFLIISCYPNCVPCSNYVTEVKK